MAGGISDQVRDCLQSRAGLNGRDADTKRSAVSGSAFDADMARVFLHYAVGNGQTKPGAAANALGGVERVVNLGHIFRRDADAAVDDLDRERVVVRRNGGDFDRT